MAQIPDPRSLAAPNAAPFSKQVLVRFSDCDPAGIVFYPKYFEMFNNLIEDWCRDALHFSFNEIVVHRGWGLPTVHLDVNFLAPSSFGETLQSSLRLGSVGNTSVTLEITLLGSDKKLRVTAKIVMVLIDRATTRAIPFPAEVRQRLQALLATSASSIEAQPK